jgi:hypothetical protein
MSFKCCFKVIKSLYALKGSHWYFINRHKLDIVQSRPITVQEATKKQEIIVDDLPLKHITAFRDEEYAIYEKLRDASRKLPNMFGKLPTTIGKPRNMFG